MNINNITKTFRHLKKTGKKALIPYLTAGDPDLDKTCQLLNFYGENGADLIEVGVPFSDPMADGPVIQRAMDRALKAGLTLKDVLELVRDFKSRHNIPIVLMGYFNPFFAYGIERFGRDASVAGVDGVLTVDLPPDEARIFIQELKKHHIINIFLATPVTDERRMAIIKRVAKGFLYFVSVTGVTGERDGLPDGIEKKIEEIKAYIEIPIVLGFGVSSGEIIRKYSPYVDGFVVGSALVKRWEEVHVDPDKYSKFVDFFKEIRNGLL